MQIFIEFRRKYVLENEKFRNTLPAKLRCLLNLKCDVWYRKVDTIRKVFVIGIVDMGWHSIFRSKKLRYHKLKPHKEYVTSDKQVLWILNWVWFKNIMIQEQLRIETEK